MWGWRSSKKRDNEAVRERYARFVQQHGELFEDKMEPLTEADIKDIEKRKKKLDRWWIVVSGLAITLLLSYLIFASEYLFDDFFNFGWLLLVVIGGGALLRNHFVKTLKYNEKRVIQGVITAKIMVNSWWDDDKNGCYFELSTKQKFQVWSKEYKKFGLGDIIRIEKLSEDFYIRHKIILLGTI